MILIIDNYDSFTFNLQQYLAEVSDGKNDIQVIRNDQIDASLLNGLSPSHIVISPGPCTPNEAGVSMEVVKKHYKQTPILGVCLGHQSIAQAFGAEIVHAGQIMHGKTSSIAHKGNGIFKDIENNFLATRYHSLAIREDTLPPEFEINARSEDGEIMAIVHKNYPWLNGVQFHPESILTKEGKSLLKNFLNTSSR